MSLFLHPSAVLERVVSLSTHDSVLSLTDADKDDSDDDFDAPSKKLAGNDLDDSDDDENADAGGGLFDSSSEDDDVPSHKKEKKLGGAKKLKAKSSHAKTPSKTEAASEKTKRNLKERMEALAKKRQAAPEGGKEADASSSKEPKKKRAKTSSKKQSSDEAKTEGDDGYESGDSYDSANFQRTKEDDDFIDAEGEDPDALKELYAEQHFEDERPDDSDSEDDAGKKKKSGGRGGSKGNGKYSAGGGLDKIDLGDAENVDETADASSALVAAVRRMAKKKKENKKLSELEDAAKEFLSEMDEAANLDDEAIAERRPATKKLAMLPKVLETLAKKDMVRPLLDLELLTCCKRWVQPLPNGSLGNVTLRAKIIEAIAGMTGETGINAGDLKRSGFGKVVMTLYMHKSETPAMKKILKNVIEMWSRPIFQKSGSLKDLERVQGTRGMSQDGLVGIARVQQMQQSPGNARGSGRPGKNEDDLANIISGGSKTSRDLGNNRVRVPYSKGFQFSVRPTNRLGDVSDKRNLVSARGKDGEKRDSLSKRMNEKKRGANRQGQRSANISIEGRPVK